MALTDNQLSTYRTSLNRERRRILGNIESLHEELGSSLSEESEENGLETHMGDVATITFLRERNLTIEEHEEHLLSEIDDALERMKDGSYGTCIDCGTAIPADRLEALPWASRCIEHAEANAG